jgi:UDP-N-acetylmuramoyl-L-alanyl-D-glutamate--2,6-diaminopimelate ligase
MNPTTPPKHLNTLLVDLPGATVTGSADRLVAALSLDSRKVQEGTLFVAVRGTQADGHMFIEKAITLGAPVILCETLPTALVPEVTYVQVPDSARAMGLLASSFYGHPSRQFTLVGVTGTNGKTSVATLLFRMFRSLGHRCGLISTVQNQIEDAIIPSTHTTPDAIALNALLADMQQQKCSHVFMEVSSHAVAQQRIAGLTFAGGIFTNITHDHLDFHGTFDNYIRAKKGFFDQLPQKAFALVNSDDRRGSVMVQNTAAKVETYSLQTLATFKGKLLSETFYGMHMDLNGQEVWFRLIGRFNAYNLLAVYGAAVLLGEAPEEALAVLSELHSPPGRFEQVPSAQKVVGIVDYAHTPDALQNVLETITHLREGNEQIITVVGCGGNRDAEKRPKMAAIASKLSDRVILTSDNPRFEEPEVILEQMLAGVPLFDQKRVAVVANRREAIYQACAEARSGDIVLIAGKGHETYQEIKGVKYDFDDRTVLREAFAATEKRG